MGWREIEARELSIFEVSAVEDIVVCEILLVVSVSYALSDTGIDLLFKAM
jgi:hypothetical protein